MFLLLPMIDCTLLIDSPQSHRSNAPFDNEHCPVNGFSSPHDPQYLSSI